METVCQEVLIAELGEGEPGHSFGGTRWKVVSPPDASPPACLFLTLDTRDSRLNLPDVGPYLPLCSRIDGMSESHDVYSFNHAERIVRFESSTWSVPIEPEYLIPTPFEERRLRLRAPTTEEVSRDYDTIIRTMLGGDGFIRIGGQPLWVLDPVDVTCDCSGPIQFVASIGNENYGRPSGIVTTSEPLFLGELALHFFLCASSSRIIVVTEPTG